MKRPRSPDREAIVVRAARKGAGAGEGEGEGGDGDSATMTSISEDCSVGLRVHEWGLNPLFWSYVKLFVRDVHGMAALEGVDDSHFLHGKAAHRVEVLGVVVHVKPGQTKTLGSYVKYILDDGTGLLPCTQYERHAGSGVLHKGHASRHELGALLLVRGKLKSYRGAREVTIASAWKPADPDEESLHWLRCMELATTTYHPDYNRADFVDDERLASSGQDRSPRCKCDASYAESIGYCRCVASTLALDPAFEFRECLLASLAEKEQGLPPEQPRLRFQFAQDVRDDPSLRRAAVRVVSPEEAPSGDRLGGGGGGAGRRKDTERVVNAKVMELLRAVMFSLHRDGAVRLLDNAEDAYMLVSRGRVLRPSVEAVCRQQGLRLTQENEIVLALQGTALLHYVSGARLRACVHSMKRPMIQEEDSATTD